jgi:16S rRNA (uracil1498-N3)-methyltransferase
VPPRFYVPDLDPRSERIPLPDEEAEHLSRVMRLGAGAEVEIFDGRGGLWRAEVVQAGKRAVFVKPIAKAKPAAEATVAITLVACVLKSDKMDDVIRDAVMLGVAAIQPVVSARTEVSLSNLARGRRADRWQRIAVSSAKQCGRAVVPPVREAITLDQYWQAESGEPRLFCAEPKASLEGEGFSRRLLHDIPSPPSAHLIVGPEGGWTLTEVASAVDARAILITLGARTLRADAVPIVALTALLTVWGELR